jgi:hypothetical protein
MRRQICSLSVIDGTQNSSCGRQAGRRKTKSRRGWSKSAYDILCSREEYGLLLLMPIVNFPFLRISQDPVERPILVVKIVNPQTGSTFDSIGIIDTGADACAIPAGYGRILGYDIESGIPKLISTGKGVTTAYSHLCRLEIYKTDLFLKGSAEVIYTTSEVNIDFMENLPVILLGVSNFLGQFFVGIDYRAQLFSLRLP